MTKNTTKVAIITHDSRLATITIDGLDVGYIHSAYGEHWVKFHCTNRPIARFKYARAKASAKAWVKFMLQRMEPAEIAEKLLDANNTPVSIANEFGYVSPNMKKYLLNQIKETASGAR